MAPDFRGMQLDHARSYLDQLVDRGLLEKIETIMEAHKLETDPDLRFTPEESYTVAFAVVVEELCLQVPDDFAQDRP